MKASDIKWICKILLKCAWWLFQAQRMLDCLLWGYIFLAWRPWLACWARHGGTLDSARSWVFGLLLRGVETKCIWREIHCFCPVLGIRDILVPDPRIRTSGWIWVQLWIRIRIQLLMLLLSSMTLKMQNIIVFHIFLWLTRSLKIIFFLKFCITILFCKHYFSLLNTFMRKCKDPYLWQMDPGPGSIPLISGSGSGRPKNMRIRILTPNTAFANIIWETQKREKWTFTKNNKLNKFKRRIFRGFSQKFMQIFKNIPSSRNKRKTIWFQPYWTSF